MRDTHTSSIRSLVQDKNMLPSKSHFHGLERLTVVMMQWPHFLVMSARVRDFDADRVRQMIPIWKSGVRISLAAHFLKIKPISSAASLQAYARDDGLTA